MQLKFDNRNLTEDQPYTTITTSLAAAAVTLTVVTNNGLADNDYLLIGKIGEQKTEIVKIGAAVVAGTSITVGALAFSHDIDTPVTKIPYNQVRFYQGTTNVGSASTALAAAQAINPSDIYTYYNDSLNSTGYGFVRAYNSTTTEYSNYSDAIDYSEKTGYTPRMLRRIRDKVRRLIHQTDEQDSDYTNDEIDEEINMAQDEVAHDRMWSFYEKIKSFSSVANQFEYDLDSSCFVVFDAMYNTQPLMVTDRHRMNILRWKTDVTGDPTTICMWGRKANVYPYPSASASADTLDGAITAAATTILLDDNSELETQGRILIESEVISYTGKNTKTALDGNHTAVVTTITVDSTTGFPSAGTITIDSEDITYTGVGATSFTGCTRGANSTTAVAHLDGASVVASTITGCTRGDEGTTAAVHSDATAITKRDFMYHFQEEPDDLENETDETSIPEPSVLAYKAAAELSEGPLHDRMLAKADKAMVQLRKVDEPKIKRIFGQVRDVSEVVGEGNIVRDQNQYPLA